MNEAPELGMWICAETARTSRVIELLRVFLRDGDAKIGVQTEKGIEHDFGITTCKGELVIVPTSLLDVHERMKKARQDGSGDA